MSEAVSDDTLRSITLPLLFIEPVRTGRLKSTPDAPLQMPYAKATSELARREPVGTGTVDPTTGQTVIYWHDHRKVTIKVWGLKDDVVSAIAILTGIFNLGTTLTYPSGARFIRWWADGDAKFYQDTTTKTGEDVWIGEIVGDVWSVRPQ